MSIGQGSALGSAMVRRSGDTMTGHLTLEGEMRFAGAGAAPDVALQRLSANILDLATGDLLRLNGAVVHTTEAKTTAGTAASESVTWTTAFTNTPSVVGAAIAASAHICTVTSRSTTGATVKSYDGGGSQQSVVKMVMAQEPS